MIEIKAIIMPLPIEIFLFATAEAAILMAKPPKTHEKSSVNITPRTSAVESMKYGNTGVDQWHTIIILHGYLLKQFIIITASTQRRLEWVN
ncbi:MAG: hypothetical protein ACYCSA_03770 [Thermoplasmataceae archaeon]